MIFKAKAQLNNLKDSQQGIAIVLSVLILSNLLMLTFIVADVIIRIGKSSQQISESEVAYFAAESAVEESIYQIEQNQDATNLGTLGSPSINSLSYTEGNWETYIEPVYETVPTCIDDQQRITFPANPTTQTDKSCLYVQNWSSGDNLITRTNPLQIRLKPGKSFELDFEISAPVGFNFYPSAVTVDWPGRPDGRVVVLSPTGQNIVDTSSQNQINRIPSSGQLGDSPDYHIRIINNDSNDIIYSIGPQIGGSTVHMPIGISLSSKGYFSDDKKKERIIEVERRNWAIY
jgi:hypothetical protein